MPTQRVGTRHINNRSVKFKGSDMYPRIDDWGSFRHQRERDRKILITVMVVLLLVAIFFLWCTNEYFSGLDDAESEPLPTETGSFAPTNPPRQGRYRDVLSTKHASWEM